MIAFYIYILIITIDLGFVFCFLLLPVVWWESIVQTMGMATLHTKDMEVTPKATVMMTTEVDMVMEVNFFQYGFETD